MKKQYLFITLFLIWSLVVVGLVVREVKAEAILVSVIEILVLLLVTFFFGYVIAKTITEENAGQQQKKLASNNAALQNSNKELRAYIETVREKYKQDMGANRQRINELSLERDQLQQQLHSEEFLSTSRLETNTSLLNETQQQLSEVISERDTLKQKLNEQETELGTLRYKIRQLDFQNKELEESKQKLSSKVENLQNNEHSALVLTTVAPDEKDNLTKIKGIGPFIEKRLNMIGIYTFKQISELTPELIVRIGNAIESFPGRIERENWVGQAKSLMGN